MRISTLVFAVLLANATLPAHADTADVPYMSATEIAGAIRAGDLSSVEAVTALLDHIVKYDAAYNAVVAVDRGRALREAAEADAARADGKEMGSLHGVPVTVKDCFMTKGLATTAGFEPLKDFVPDRDAVVVRLLRDAGAIVIGKTNMPTMAMDMQTDNPVYGRTNNPWDTTRTTGGSSGGCAAALAAGFTPLSFGSDLAGSIRLPSALCGVYGLKTTYGTVSKDGHIPPAPGQIDAMKSLGCMGPLARNIDDLELALDVIGVPSAYDQRVAPLLPSSPETVNLAGLKIAWTGDFAGVPVCKDVKTALAVFVKKLEDAGATVVKTEPKDFPYVEVWETWGELLGLMTNYDQSAMARKMSGFFAKGILEPIPMQRRILGKQSLPKYMEAVNRQKGFINRLDTFLSDYDVWLCPACVTTAFKHHAPSGQAGVNNIYKDPLIIDGDEVHYYVATQSYTTIFNVTESPVLSMPIGTNSDGLPVGMQVVGRRFHDYRLLKIGKALAVLTEPMRYPLAGK